MIIDPTLAKSFVNRIAGYTKYGLNIMDHRGIVIASTDENRVGTFHEVALQIIRENQEIIAVSDDSIWAGVRKGVNAAICYNGQKVGVVGIPGEPDEVMSLTMLVKMAVEVMLEHEFYRYERYQRGNLKDQLLFNILYNNSFSRSELERLAGSLNLNTEYLRIPVLIYVEAESARKAELSEEMSNLLKNSARHSSQDLIGRTKNDDIIAFITVKERQDDILSQYKFLAGDAISELLRYLRSMTMNFGVYIGPLQNDMLTYSTGYRCCEWLMSVRKKSGSYYFYDCLEEYFVSSCDRSVLQNVFSPLAKLFDSKETDSFMELMGAVIDANYNLNDTSQLMHVHKNTVSYRLNKIREILNVNPFNDHRDMTLLNSLYYYLKEAAGGEGTSS